MSITPREILSAWNTKSPRNVQSTPMLTRQRLNINFCVVVSPSFDPVTYTPRDSLVLQRQFLTVVANPDNTTVKEVKAKTLATWQEVEKSDYRRVVNPARIRNTIFRNSDNSTIPESLTVTDAFDEREYVHVVAVVSDDDRYCDIVLEENIGDDTLQLQITKRHRSDDKTAFPRDITADEHLFPHAESPSHTDRYRKRQRIQRPSELLFSEDGSNHQKDNAQGQPTGSESKSPNNVASLSLEVADDPIDESQQLLSHPIVVASDIINLLPAPDENRAGDVSDGSSAKSDEESESAGEEEGTLEEPADATEDGQGSFMEAPGATQNHQGTGPTIPDDSIKGSGDESDAEVDKEYTRPDSKYDADSQGDHENLSTGSDTEGEKDHESLSTEFDTDSDKDNRRRDAEFTSAREKNREEEALSDVGEVDSDTMVERAGVYNHQSPPSPVTSAEKDRNRILEGTSEQESETESDDEDAGLEMTKESLVLSAAVSRTISGGHINVEEKAIGNGQVAAPVSPPASPRGTKRKNTWTDDSASPPKKMPILSDASSQLPAKDDEGVDVVHSPRAMTDSDEEDPSLSQILGTYSQSSSPNLLSQQKPHLRGGFSQPRHDVIDSKVSVLSQSKLGAMKVRQPIINLSKVPRVRSLSDIARTTDFSSSSQNMNGFQFGQHGTSDDHDYDDEDEAEEEEDDADSDSDDASSDDDAAGDADGRLSQPTIRLAGRQKRKKRKSLFLELAADALRGRETLSNSTIVSLSQRSSSRSSQRSQRAACVIPRVQRQHVQATQRTSKPIATDALRKSVIGRRAGKTKEALARELDGLDSD